MFSRHGRPRPFCRKNPTINTVTKKTKKFLLQRLQNNSCSAADKAASFLLNSKRPCAVDVLFRYGMILEDIMAAVTEGILASVPAEHKVTMVEYKNGHFATGHEIRDVSEAGISRSMKAHGKAGTVYFVELREDRTQ